MAQAKGNVMLAHEIAKTYFKDTPEVVNVLKAAISLGGTQNLARANDGGIVTKAAVTVVSGTDTALVQYKDIEAEFIELLRPRTIMGRMTQLTRVPFLSRSAASSPASPARSSVKARRSRSRSRRSTT
jgi:hypothetical protein